MIKYSKWSCIPYDDSKYSSNKPNYIVVHHTYQPRSNSTGKTVVANIEKFHIIQKSFHSIGYHYIIDSNGTVYEGRKERHNGAHCVGLNQISLGICVIGNYDEGRDILTPKAETALFDLLTDIRSRYRNITLTDIKGHRDFSDKSCPGDTLYQKLLQYKGEPA